MSEVSPIYYPSIPGSAGGGGGTFLSIYPPGSWMGNEGYVCFIGGRGIGSADTLAEAKKLLLKEAKLYCIRTTEEARMRATHYEAELHKLCEKGLGCKLRAGERP